ncbi:hypothetical protein [Streptomyces sp. NPDC020917]|uniref:hypothetical protein n=1 Tax=Streptomyces sp. NPDC020917 TaxID=3365102 RepID=UPI0037B86399
MRALEFAGEELQADVSRLQFLSQGRRFDAAAEPLVLCTTSVTRTPEARSSLAWATALSSSGRWMARVENLLEEDPGDPGFGERVDLGVEGLPGSGRTGVPQTGMPDGLGLDTGGLAYSTVASSPW